MGTAEEEREERMRRNEEMLRKVTGAAEDLASSVRTSPKPDREALRREELKQRLASEAKEFGIRKSSRLASSAARERISKSLYTDDAPANESTSASGSIECGDSSDEQDSDVSESPPPPHSGDEKDGANDASAQVFTPLGKHVAMSEDEEEMRLAIALSLAGDSVAKSDTRQAVARRQEEAGGGGTEGVATPGHARKQQDAATSHKKKGRKRKKRLDIADADIDAVFEFIGEGKVTIGRAEIVKVINKLGLDVDEGMLDAAFEVLQDSDCAGPCNRLDRAGLRRFVVQLEE